MTDPEIAVHLRASNEHLAKCRDTYKDKVVAMATSVPNGGDENLRELERAVKEDDLRAVIINASHKGEYPDADGAKPFWKLVTDLDIPVFLHPGWCGDNPAMQEYRLNSSVGRPADNCLSIARIIVRGILRAVSDAEAGRQPSRRRHLRDDRTARLCLRPDRGIVVPRPLRADVHQARAEPLPEDDLSRLRPATRRPPPRWRWRPSVRTSSCSGRIRRR